MEELSFETCLELLQTEHVAHVAVSTDRGPYVTPVAYVFSGDHLAFRTRTGTRLAAIDRDPRVCIEVSRHNLDTGEWKCVIARGTAHRVSGGPHMQQILAAILRKYGPTVGAFVGRAADDEVVVTVEIVELTGRGAGPFDAGGTPLAR